MEKSKFCKYCYYFRKLEILDELREDYCDGECHRYPPPKPATNSNSYCGEWKSK